MILLHDLEVGRAAHISRVAGPPAYVQQMAEFGLYPGVRVKMIQPGKPCIIRLTGNPFSARSTISMQPYDTLRIGVRL